MAVTLACALAPLVAHAGERLLVVTTVDTGMEQQVLAGLQQAMPGAQLLPLGSDDAALARGLARLPRDGAVVTLGRRAAAAVAAAAPAYPVVHCAAAGDVVPRPPGVLVVPLAVPPDAQIAWLQRLLPGVRTVGLLFDPAQNERRAADSATAWQQAGFVPVLEPVAGPTSLPAALARLKGRVDVLQAMPDSTVFAAEHSRSLLLFSFRQRIPLVGPSDGWVRAGALYAVDWDLADLGRYCGALALHQATGGKAPVPPPRTRVVANLRSADQFRVEWDAETRKSFERVYE